MRVCHVYIAAVCAALSLADCASAHCAEVPAQEDAGWWGWTRAAAKGAWDQTLRSLRPAQEQDTFGEVWDGLMPRLDEALVLTDRQPSLPQSAWFGSDQVSNQADIDRLLDEATQILAISPSQRHRARIRELEAEARRARAEIADYRRRRVSAPHDSLWRRTVADYDAAIDERQDRLAALAQEQKAVYRSFAADLQAMGLEVSDEQLEFLLSTVVGDDLVQMTLAFDNVKAVTAELERLTEKSREDLVSARRYYGMYTVLLRILDRMHERVMTDLDQRYLVELDAIIDRTEALLSKTQALRRGTEKGHDAFTANIEAQEFTLKAAKEYRAYLQEQRRLVATARQRLAQDIAIAVNTYETVKVSGDLADLMKSSQNLLENLRRLQVPALRTFENVAMKREFSRLTLRLKSPQMP
jgi:hypothetical protein